MKIQYAPRLVRNRSTGAEMTRAESAKMNAAHRRPAPVDHAAKQRRCAKAIASLVLDARGYSSLRIGLHVDHAAADVLYHWMIDGQGSLPE